MGNRVLVRLAVQKTSSESPSPITIVRHKQGAGHDINSKVEVGVVVKVGPGYQSDSIAHKRIAPDVSVGDMIRFKGHARGGAGMVKTSIKLQEEEYLVVPAADIIAKWTISTPTSSDR